MCTKMFGVFPTTGYTVLLFLGAHLQNLIPTEAAIQPTTPVPTTPATTAPATTTMEGWPQPPSTIIGWPQPPSTIIGWPQPPSTIIGWPQPPSTIIDPELTTVEELPTTVDTTVGPPMTIMDCSFNGIFYENGQSIENACALLICDESTGQFLNDGYKKSCSSCINYWDPHIMTYDQSNVNQVSNSGCNWDDEGLSDCDEEYGSFAYQHCGKYSLTQPGDNRNPPFAVYATFDTCEDGLDDITCVDTVNFVNDATTNVYIAYASNQLKIQVNDNDVDHGSLSSLPSKLNGGSVLAWTSEYFNDGRPTSCVNLQGSSGILVRYCGDPYNTANTVVVFAPPAVVGDGNVLQGLCGNANGNVFDDYKSRDGKDVPSISETTRWQAPPYTGDGTCVNNGRRKREAIQNRCKNDSYVEKSIYHHCKVAVGDGFNDDSPHLAKILIDDCVYDLCNVSDPIQWMKTIKATVEVLEDIQNNTKESLFVTEAPIILPTPPPKEETGNEQEENISKNLFLQVIQRVN